MAEPDSSSNPPVIPVTEDERCGPPFMAGERDSLESWLEFYRVTLPIKLAGLTAEQLCVRSVPPSSLSLLGLLRHLTRVEQYWFTEVVTGTPTPRTYRTDVHPDGDLDLTDPAEAAGDLQRYHAEVEQARAHAALVGDLDAALPGLRHGEQVNLRWVYVHMIEEYARHLGHVDLLREMLDGATGY
jgi:Protein of unknown function (DUF664)